MLFEHETDRQSVQTSSEGLGKSNAIKQTLEIVMLAYFTLNNPIRTEKAAKILNCPFYHTGFLYTKWRRPCTFERNNFVTTT